MFSLVTMLSKYTVSYHYWHNKRFYIDFCPLQFVGITQGFKRLDSFKFLHLETSVVSTNLEIPIW